QLRCDTSSARSPAHTVSDLFPSHPLPPATYTLSLHDALPISGDGFEVARADLAQRGPGDFFGRRQHGLPALHVADLAADLALMQDAREEAETILQHDPTLSGYPLLYDRVQRMFAARDDEAFN